MKRRIVDLTNHRTLGVGATRNWTGGWRKNDLGARPRFIGFNYLSTDRIRIRTRHAGEMPVWTVWPHVMLEICP